jgi:hypothetical protein
MFATRYPRVQCKIIILQYDMPVMMYAPAMFVRPVFPLRLSEWRQSLWQRLENDISLALGKKYNVSIDLHVYMVLRMSLLLTGLKTQ